MKKLLSKIDSLVHGKRKNNKEKKKEALGTTACLRAHPDNTSTMTSEKSQEIKLAGRALKRSLKVKQKKEKSVGKKKHQRRYYPVDDVRKRSNPKIKHKPAKLKVNIKPGSILILVSTKYRGKRVVFLKQLVSGLLLVVGPYGINGVPLCRVDQCHVITTSTHLDISGVEIPERIDDNYFRHKKLEKKKQKKEKNEEIFVDKVEESTKPPQQHIEDAKEIERQLKMSISSIPTMKTYLSTPFSLSHGQYPHELVF
ncbi:hypothetical protein HZS_7067 [Henneguya salminicola]|nr:hypothetical protein HZS_7067 [Henneguya salminicola]